MTNQSILVSIYNAVNTIKWKTPLQKQKAQNLCASIFNLYRVNNQLYSDYLSLSKKYFITILPSNRDLKIKDILVANGILICDEKYSVKKGIGKGYKFNSKFFSRSNYSSINQTFTQSTQLTTSTTSTISPLCPHFDPQYHYTFQGQKLKVKPATNSTNNSFPTSTISYLFPHFDHQFYYTIQGQDSRTNQTFTQSTQLKSSTTSTISYLFPHQEPCFYNSSQTAFLQNYYYQNLDQLNFNNDVDTAIKELSQIQANIIKIDHQITDEFVYLTFNKTKYRYTLNNALKLATDNNLQLIQFKDKCYIDTPENFIEQKQLQLEIIYAQSVFNINNKLFYCSRNETNNRLDHNLTGLKKELFDYLLFDGEKLVELDIANAQFAIAAHLNPTIDDHFIYHAQNGGLYSLIETALNLPKGQGKELMFRVAFDKVKHNEEYDQIRNQFPIYMNWVDSYKHDNSYKAFSNMLQKKEAEIMIDGLLMLLIAKGYRVFTIHDALRVKESEADAIKIIMEEYFNSIDFKCFVRKK